MGKIKCMGIVYTGNWGVPNRCSRNAVNDGYCKQHHPDAVAKRKQEADIRYEEKQKNSPYYRLKIAKNKIKELEVQLATIERDTAEKCKEIASEEMLYDTYTHDNACELISNAIETHFNLGEKP